MTKRTQFKCYKCGHGSLVRSNFKEAPSIGEPKFFCKSVKKPACESEFQHFFNLTKPQNPKYNVVEWK